MVKHKSKTENGQPNLHFFVQKSDEGNNFCCITHMQRWVPQEAIIVSRNNIQQKENMAK